MWLNLQFPVDLVIFTEEIRSGKLHILYSVLLFITRCNCQISPTNWVRKIRVRKINKHFRYFSFKNQFQITKYCHIKTSLKISNTHCIFSDIFVWHMSGVKNNYSAFFTTNVQFDVFWNVFSRSHLLVIFLILEMETEKRFLKLKWLE